MIFPCLTDRLRPYVSFAFAFSIFPSPMLSPQQGVLVGDGVRVGVIVLVGVRVGVAETVANTVGVRVGVREEVGNIVGVRVGVREEVGNIVGVCMTVAVRDKAGVGVRDIVGVGTPDIIAIGDSGGEGAKTRDPPGADSCAETWEANKSNTEKAAAIG